MRRTKHSGFTLVEILIVVVILAILAAAVIPQFTESGSDAKQSTMAQNLRSLRLQISMYQAQHAGLSPDATIATQLISKTNVDGTTSGTPNIGPYFFALPPNPQITDPTAQALIKVDSSDPTAPITTHGWIYNSTNGRIFSATEITR